MSVPDDYEQMAVAAAGESAAADGAEDPATRQRLRGPFRTALVVAVVMLAVTLTRAASTPSPYAAVRPGPTGDLYQLVSGEVRDADFGAAGRLLYTTVRVSELSWGEYLRSKLPWDHTEVVPAAGTSTPQDRVAALRQMDAAQQAAVAVAVLTVDGHDALRTFGSGAAVFEVVAGSPADRAGVLAGDVIVEVDGVAVATFADLAAAIRSHAGDDVTVALERSSRTTVTDIEIGEDGRIGVVGATNLTGELPLTADMSQVGGSSAGLMMTLSFIDALGDGSLAHGRTIAGTGTIDVDGSVGEIRGARHKVTAARAAGAEVFFVPAGNAAEARAAAGDALEVVVAEDLDDALGWLCAHGADDEVCNRGA